MKQRSLKSSAPYNNEGRTGHSPFALESRLSEHFMPQWFNLRAPAMEETFLDTPHHREFSQLSAFGHLPDESTILRFRHRLKKHKHADQVERTINELLEQRGYLLKFGTTMDTTHIAAPSVFGGGACQSTGGHSEAKSTIRVKVEHPFRVIKSQLGFAEVRYRTEEEHLADQNAVCSVQSVDDSSQTTD